MAIGGIPVVIVTNGAPISPGARGVPVTIVGGGVVLSEGETVAVTTSSASKSVGGTVDIEQGAFRGVNLQPDTALVEDQDIFIATITGNLTNPSGGTVTVANGIITAIVLS